MSGFVTQASSGERVHPEIISMMVGEPMPEIQVNTTEWIDVEFEVALDSGCTDNVCHSTDAPGYIISQSMGSKCGQVFWLATASECPMLVKFVDRHFQSLLQC